METDAPNGWCWRRGGGSQELRWQGRGQPGLVGEPPLGSSSEAVCSEGRGRQGREGLLDGAARTWARGRPVCVGPGWHPGLLTPVPSKPGWDSGSQRAAGAWL